MVCPAFVADCLETLEEIGLRGRATFLGAGGEFLALIRSLNAHAAWADAVAELARRHARPAAGADRPRAARGRLDRRGGPALRKHAIV